MFNDDANPEILSNIRFIVGKWICVCVILLLIANCWFISFLPTLVQRTANFELYISISIGLLVAEAFIVAGLLTWAPTGAFIRAAVVTGLGTISLVAGYAGHLNYQIVNNVWYNVPWGDIARAVFLFPLIVVSFSLPCLLIRSVRGWRLSTLPAHQFQQQYENGNHLRERNLELINCCVLMSVSIAILALAHFVSGFGFRHLSEIVGSFAAGYFLIGVAVMLPFSRLLLRSKRYVFWAAIALLIGILAGFAFAVTAFLVSSPFNIGFFGFLRTSEFVICNGFCTSLFLTVSIFSVGVRLMGYTLIIPQMAAAQIRHERTKSTHPLDDD